MFRLDGSNVGRALCVYTFCFDDVLGIRVCVLFTVLQIHTLSIAFYTGSTRATVELARCLAKTNFE